MSKVKTSFTLSQEAIDLLKALADTYQISRSAVLELAIREKVERQRVSEILRQGDATTSDWDQMIRVMMEDYMTDFDGEVPGAGGFVEV